MKSWLYDLVYRRGAPWEIGPRSELVDLVTSGLLRPAALPRAVDLGCGTGANAVFLAEHGFDVTGVDFSGVALAKARRTADAAGVGRRCRFVQADLTRPSLPGVEGPFDLLVDYGTLDDLRGAARRSMTDLIIALSHGGSRFLLWCFQGERRELPWMSFSGPSRLFPGLEPGEEDSLFGDRFTIDRLSQPSRGSGFACYLLTGVGDPETGPTG